MVPEVVEVVVGYVVGVAVVLVQVDKSIVDDVVGCIVRHHRFAGVVVDIVAVVAVGIVVAAEIVVAVGIVEVVVALVVLVPVCMRIVRDAVGCTVRHLHCGIVAVGIGVWPKWLLQGPRGSTNWK